MEIIVTFGEYKMTKLIEASLNKHHPSESDKNLAFPELAWIFYGNIYWEMLAFEYFCARFFFHEYRPFFLTFSRIAQGCKKEPIRGAFHRRKFIIFLDSFVWKFAAFKSFFPWKPDIFTLHKKEWKLKQH